MFIIITFSLLVGCQQHSHTKLEEAIFAIVEEETFTEFNLSPFTNFPWEKAAIFEPYTTQDKIEETLGVKLIQTGGIEYRDDIFLLVFTNKNKVVQYALLQRNAFAFNSVDEIMTPGSDLIKIIR